MRGKGKREKNIKMYKSKVNAAIYIYMYIYTHIRGHTNIYKYRNTYTNMPIICYSS